MNLRNLTHTSWICASTNWKVFTFIRSAPYFACSSKNFMHFHDCLYFGQQQKAFYWRNRRLVDFTFVKYVSRPHWNTIYFHKYSPVFVWPEGSAVELRHFTIAHSNLFSVIYLWSRNWFGPTCSRAQLWVLIFLVWTFGFHSNMTFSTRIIVFSRQFFCHTVC